MGHCGCGSTANTASERKILSIALVLNMMMFAIGLIAGLFAQSASLIADSLDMLADASAYSIGLLAIRRSSRFKVYSAMFSGGLLLVLSIVVLIEVIRRAWLGSSPESTTMIIVACISLVVNASVLRMLNPFRQGETYLRAVWIFTRADVIVNISVIVSGILVALSKSRYPDLIVGFAVSLYVIKEAFEILRSTRNDKS